MKKYYAGIGSRKTPNNILQIMTSIAHFLEEEGYILRSGGAHGADTAFEVGSNKNKQIFLPWKNFNNHTSCFWKISKEAEEMAKKFHPSYDYLKKGAKRLHARNCYQVLGIDLKTPVDFIICWTPNGEDIGGTAQALRIARANNIKIYNLGKDQDLKYWKNKIKINDDFKKWKKEIIKK